MTRLWHSWSFRQLAWAQVSGVAAYYSLELNDLNDDLLGRAFEHLTKHGDAAQAPLVLQAIHQFELNVN